MIDSPSGRSPAMWVLCCGMRRGGSTLQYQVVSHIVALHEGVSIGVTSPEAFDEQYGRYSEPESIVVVKCLQPVPALEKMAEKGEAKLLYVYRDIRDVVVSIMKKYGRGFVSLIRAGTMESILREYEHWTHADAVYIAKYEAMVGSLHDEVERISAFLGLPVSEEDRVRIADECSLDKQKERIRSFDYTADGMGEARNRYDPQSLLHHNHIRSGKSEQWKSDLSTLQIAYLEEKFGDWLQACGYTLSRSWLSKKVAGIVYWVAVRLYLIGERIRKPDVPGTS